VTDCDASTSNGNKVELDEYGRVACSSLLACRFLQRTSVCCTASEIKRAYQVAVLQHHELPRAHVLADVLIIGCDALAVDCSLLLSSVLARQAHFVHRTSVVHFAAAPANFSIGLVRPGMFGTMCTEQKRVRYRCHASSAPGSPTASPFRVSASASTTREPRACSHFQSTHFAPLDLTHSTARAHCFPQL